MSGLKPGDETAPMRILTFLLLSLLLSSTLYAQSGGADLQVSVGYAHMCFLADYGHCGKSHLSTALSPRFYFTRRWAIQPEFIYGRMIAPARDDHFALTINFTADAGEDKQLKPYLLLGAGWVHEEEYGRNLNSVAINVGFGLKIYVSRNVFIPFELRAGPTGLLLRLATGIGYSFGRQ
jgi:hypothetical protein